MSDDPLLVPSLTWVTQENLSSSSRHRWCTGSRTCDNCGRDYDWSEEPCGAPLPPDDVRRGPRDDPMPPRVQRPPSVSAETALAVAQRHRVEVRDMLAVFLLTRQREGDTVIRFDDPRLAALMRVCTEADEAVIQAAARIIREQR